MEMATPTALLLVDSDILDHFLTHQMIHQADFQSLQTLKPLDLLVDLAGFCSLMMAHPRIFDLIKLKWTPPHHSSLQFHTQLVLPSLYQLMQLGARLQHHDLASSSLVLWTLLPMFVTPWEIHISTMMLHSCYIFGLSNLPKLKLVIQIGAFGVLMIWTNFPSTESHCHPFHTDPTCRSLLIALKGPSLGTVQQPPRMLSQRCALWATFRFHMTNAACLLAPLIAMK
jgi:hypothetical protein